MKSIEQIRADRKLFINEYLEEIHYRYHERLGMIFDDYEYRPLLHKEMLAGVWQDVKDWMIEKGFNPDDRAGFIEIYRKIKGDL